MKNKVIKRTYTMGIRLKANEREYLEREADERGQRLSDYVRDVLLATMNFSRSDDKINA
jgi:uncharacterized protein (DUF1778 family)